MTTSPEAALVGPSLERVVRETTPAAERLLRLLAPWERGRLRRVSRFFAALVPAEACAPCLSAMLTRGGPETFRHDPVPPCGVALGVVDLYAALAADNPHALRWARACTPAPPAGELARFAARWDRVAVLRMLLDEDPALCTVNLLAEAIEALRERAAVELLRRLLRDTWVGLGPAAMDRWHVCLYVSAAARRGLASVVKAAVWEHGAVNLAEGSLRNRLAEAALLVGLSPHPPEDLMRSPVASYRVQRLLEAGELSRAGAHAAHVSPYDLLTTAAEVPRAYDALGWAYGFLTAGGHALEELTGSFGKACGWERYVPTWHRVLLDAAIGNCTDPDAGAIRWLEDHARFVPDVSHLNMALAQRSVPTVRYLARRARPSRAYLCETTATLLKHGWGRLAELLLEVIDSDRAPPNPHDCADAHSGSGSDDDGKGGDDDGKGGDDDGKGEDDDGDLGGVGVQDEDLRLLCDVVAVPDPDGVYGALLLGRRGWFGQAERRAALLLLGTRRCGQLTTHALAAMAYAGIRLDADLVAWLDWLWPQRDQDGACSVPPDTLMRAHTLHARYATEVRDLDTHAHTRTHTDTRTPTPTTME